MNANTEKSVTNMLVFQSQKKDDCDTDFRREDKPFRVSIRLTTQNGTELRKGIPRGKASEDFVRRKGLALKVFSRR